MAHGCGQEMLFFYGAYLTGNVICTVKMCKLPYRKSHFLFKTFFIRINYHINYRGDICHIRSLIYF